MEESVLKVLAGIVIVSIFVWRCVALVRWNRAVGKERREVDKMVDCCRTCTDYDCMVACRTKQLQDEGK